MFEIFKSSIRSPEVTTTNTLDKKVADVLEANKCATLGQLSIEDWDKYLAEFSSVGGKIRVVVTFSPELCWHIMEHHADPLNRRETRSKIHQYSKDMLDDRWSDGKDMIHVAPDGTLINGHHRMHACIIAGKPFTSDVIFNFPRAGLNVPEGKTRTVADILRMYAEKEYVTQDMVAVMRLIITHFRQSGGATIPDLKEYEACEDYASDILFAIETLRSRRGLKGIGHAGTRACFVCAMNAGVDRETLSRFADILRTGEINGQKENAAIRCREFLTKDKAGEWREHEYAAIAKKVMRCIKAFDEKKPLANLVNQNEFAYPVPVINVSASRSSDVCGRLRDANRTLANIAAKRKK